MADNFEEFYRNFYITRVKYQRNVLIIQNKRTIKYWAKSYDIPPEIIAGILLMECPRFIEFIDEQLDKDIEVFYAILNKIFPDNKRDITIGPAQVSETTARKEFNRLLDDNEKVLLEDMDRNQLKTLLYDINFSIRYIAMVMGNKKKEIFPKIKAEFINDSQMERLVKQWNSNPGPFPYPNYAATFKVMLPNIRILLKE